MFTIESFDEIYIINKSKFITNLFFVSDLNDVENKIKEIKEKYKDATHHCYAYIINNQKRFNDDNEPSGTAGMPILDCLEKNNLNHVLCIVTRYFGGIKLGAGGLLRAYSNSTSNAINNGNKYMLINGYEINITFPYTKSKEIDNILENCEILDKSFETNITYTVLVDEDLLNKLKNICNVNIKKEIIIKQKI